MKLPTSLLRPWCQENTRHPFPLTASRSRGGMVRFQAWQSQRSNDLVEAKIHTKNNRFVWAKLQNVAIVPPLGA